MVACLYFIFKLETTAIIVAAALLVIIINREATADLQAQINTLKEEMMEMRIAEEMNGLDLIADHKQNKKHVPTANSNDPIDALFAETSA